MGKTHRTPPPASVPAPATDPAHAAPPECAPAHGTPRATAAASARASGMSLCVRGPLHESLSDSDLSKASTSKATKQLKLNFSARVGKRLRDDDDSCEDSDRLDSDRLDRIINMLTVLTSWKDEQTALMKILAADVSELKRQNVEIQKSHKELEISMDFMNSSCEEMRVKIQSLEKERSELRTCLSDLQNRITDLQFTSRSSTAEIRNVPYPANKAESPADLMNIVQKIGIALDVNMKTTNLRDVYRRPAKPGSSRAIVVEFSNVSARNDFLVSARKFNKERKVEDKLHTETIGIPGTRQPIYVSEYLPPTVRKLFNDVKDFAKKYNYRYWSSNGKIFLCKEVGGRPIIISSEHSLRDLQKTLK